MNLKLTVISWTKSEVNLFYNPNLRKTARSDKKGFTTKKSYRVFHSLYNIGRNGIIVFKGINNSKKKPPVGLEYNNAISANFVQTVQYSNVQPYLSMLSQWTS